MSNAPPPPPPPPMHIVPKQRKAEMGTEDHSLTKIIFVCHGNICRGDSFAS
jgi:hypothetical protein